MDKAQIEAIAAAVRSLRGDTSPYTSYAEGYEAALDDAAAKVGVALGLAGDRLAYFQTLTES